MSIFFLFFPCIQVVVHVHIRFGDFVQLQNLGTSAFLAIRPQGGKNSTSKTEVITTTLIKDTELYWGFFPSDIFLVSSKKIKCNSIITIQNSKYASFLNTYMLLDKPLVSLTQYVGTASGLWNLSCISPDEIYMKKGTIVQFKNTLYNCYLSSNFDTPSNENFQNSWALNCINENTQNTLWKADKGLFFVEKTFKS
ncbi:hypothetical protein TRFO_04724 [Tritrichomonas foetus]|uniref:MIR domain-containing protein n=1 Tax=Tritrichomonas foetus TaxID=1144522 RepID=A0A1J4KCG4_9EUKA|nr:hypothetical protein TRFO_04724 [Tritrichomonas foetus]|eukprot:OHT09113.1 hypothetical protein TRFO_04724 [Tritrichomonas foetus]